MDTAWQEIFFYTSVNLSSLALINQHQLVLSTQHIVYKVAYDQK